MKIFCLLILSVLLAGCAAPRAAKPIRLPTTAALDRSIVATQNSVTKANAIVTRSVKTGIAANSEDFKQLTLSLGMAVRDVAAARAEKDQLAAQLLTKQGEVDKQTETVTWYQAKYAEAVKSLWWYRLHFWGPLTFALVAAVIALCIRFTSWGARTFGPYVYGAQALAVKTAKVVAAV